VKSKNAVYTEQEFHERAETFDILDKTEPFIVISGRHTYASQAKMVLRRLVEPRKVPIPTPPQRTIQKHSGRIIVG
jgi:hypothetical protein